MYLPRVQYIVISHNPPLPAVVDGMFHFRGRWARTARCETTWLVHGYPRTEDLTIPLCLWSSLLLEFSLWRHNGLWPRPLSLVTSISQPRYNYIFLFWFISSGENHVTQGWWTTRILYLWNLFHQWEQDLKRSLWSVGILITNIVQHTCVYLIYVIHDKPCYKGVYTLSNGSPRY